MIRNNKNCGYLYKAQTFVFTRYIVYALVYYDDYNYLYSKI